MEIQKHPGRFFWTFGNHEPLNMYRRIGRNSTGGVPGGARWLADWHHWYDSEECAATMADLGLNILHCRCYKGLGWEEEKKDFPNVLSFARACRKHGITVLAYIQYSSLYPEIMRREIPNLIDWCQLDQYGKPQTYLDSYWRWIPCPNRPGFLDYMDGIIRRIVSSGEFDGVMFDNTLNYPCYCPECRAAFSKHLEEKGFDFLDPRFVELPPSDNKTETIGSKTEIMDPVTIEYMRFRRTVIENSFKRFRTLIKSIDPECIISANVQMAPNASQLRFYNAPAISLAPLLDVTLSQSGNEPHWNGKDICITQQHEIKFANAMHLRAVPLNDGDAGNAGVAGGAYIGPLFESLFGNTVPMDRIIMKPLRGGALNQERINARRPVIDKVHEFAKKYEEVLELPEYAPIGLLYSNDACTFSQKALEGYYLCEESLLRNHLPYRIIPVSGSQINKADLNECSVLILPNANCLSDDIVKTIQDFKGRLILAGNENGLNDENYRQRAEIPFKGENIALPPHEALQLKWKTEIRFKPDNWDELLRQEIAFSLHPAAHPVVKMDNGKVAAVLISAPCVIPEGKITVPVSMQKSGYELITLNGSRDAAFDGDTLLLEPFEGMTALIAKDHIKPHCS